MTSLSSQAQEREDYFVLGTTIRTEQREFAHKRPCSFETFDQLERRAVRQQETDHHIGSKIATYRKK